MDTPGKFLKAEREKRGISLEELVEISKIKGDYLRAIENEDYGFISGEGFIRGYIHLYAKSLGLDSSYILRLYKKQSTMVSKPEKAKNKVLTSLFEKIKKLKS